MLNPNLFVRMLTTIFLLGFVDLSNYFCGGTLTKFDFSFSYLFNFVMDSCLLQVIVRDIVGKSVVAQFRAHKSPISALCFDPSGMLLVTASIQGHNINVFKIMPGSSEVGKAYVHLYQLQRGLTNAVRAINFPLRC